MNKKQSSPVQLAKFALIVPLFAGMALYANTDKPMNVAVYEGEAVTTQMVGSNTLSEATASKPDKSKSDKSKSKKEQPAPKTQSIQMGDFAVDKTDHDFGTILEADGSVSTTFTITNTSNKPLVISKVVASCGCTTPEWTKEPIAPGKQGFVKATYAVAGRPGPFSKTITMTTSGTPATAEFHIKGTVTPKS